MVTIVVSGKPGAGTSTAAKLLAKKLGLEYFSPGAYFKKFGQGGETEKAVSFWNTKKGTSKSFHHTLDNLQKEKAKKGNIVIDGKLSIRLLRDYSDFSVWVDVAKDERARRYGKRDSITEKDAIRLIDEKESHERKNWKRIYGFDYFTQKKEADTVIDGTTAKPEKIVEKIIAKMKRVFIVHRWEATPERDWYPYVEKKMKGYAVSTPAMPDTKKPVLNKWLIHLKKTIGEPTENTYLVGHSAGVATILKYLESLPVGKKIGGCVLVAGWIDDLGYKQLHSFVAESLNWGKIRQHSKKFVVIASDTDPYVKMYHAQELKKNLRAKLIVEHNKGHLSDEEGVIELPSVVKSIREM